MLVPEMLNLLGCSEDNFAKLIKTMSYKSYQKENKLYFKYFPDKKKIFRNNKENLNKDNPFNILKGFNIK
jgi:ATP-dependent RNA helicase SUPV3L1/SUV3